MSSGFGRDVTVEEAAARVVRGEALLLDVREDDEWRVGHAPQATHIPVREVPARVRGFAHQQPLLVICRSGNRSRQVVAALREAGLSAANVVGGMKAWQQARLPLEPPDAEIA